MGDSREILVFKAKLAEEAERFEDMVAFMEEVIKGGDASLSAEERVEQRNLLSVAYKNVIGTKRASWRIISACLDKKADSVSEQEKEVIKSYKKQIENELQGIVDNVLSLLDNCILNKFEESKEEEADEKAFYYKMKGDYCRYNAEFLEDKEDTPEEIKEKKKAVVKRAEEAYNLADETATKFLSPTSPIRLGLILNYSVFHYEIKRSTDEACRLAKKAFDDAIAELDSLSETSYKDSTLIMQLLRDNLTLWTSEASESEAQ